MQVPFNKSNARILDYFKLFATSDFYQMISDQTNLYSEQHFQSNPDDKSSSPWTPSTATGIRLGFPKFDSTGVQIHFFRLQFPVKLWQKAGSRRSWSFYISLIIPEFLIINYRVFSWSLQNRVHPVWEHFNR